MSAADDLHRYRQAWAEKNSWRGRAPSLAGYYAMQPKDPRASVPMERIERAHELWQSAQINTGAAGAADDFWRLPLNEIRYWIDRAEEDLAEVKAAAAP